MTLNNFSKYHWPSQRMIVSLLTIVMAVVSLDTYGDYVRVNTIISAMIVISGLWLFFDSLFHVIELASINGYKLVRVCKAADRSRPAFLALVSAGNIFYAVNLLTIGGMGLSGAVLLHVVHALVFVYILLVDWYIDNSCKLQKARYKRG